MFKSHKQCCKFRGVEKIFCELPGGYWLGFDSVEVIKNGV